MDLVLRNAYTHSRHTGEKKDQCQTHGHYDLTSSHSPHIETLDNSLSISFFSLMHPGIYRYVLNLHHHPIRPPIKESIPPLSTLLSTLLYYPPTYLKLASSTTIKLPTTKPPLQTPLNHPPSIHHPSIHPPTDKQKKSQNPIRNNNNIITQLNKSPPPSLIDRLVAGSLERDAPGIGR